MTSEEIIKSYIEDAIKAHPIKEEGKTYEPVVHYMNGNDGTKFDWDANARTCEFFVFYKSKEALGYIKVYATKRGTLEGYVWDTERYTDGVELTPAPIGIDKARAIKRMCMKFDNNDKYDEVFITL